MRKASLAAILFLSLGCPGPDNAPPSVTILSPADNDTVRGITTVRARARDNDRVTAVELLVDGDYQATDSTGRADTFSFSLNAAALALDTTHALTCVAFDAAGNSDTSKPVRVFAWPGTRHTGAISSDETWSPAGNPHFIVCSSNYCIFLNESWLDPDQLRRDNWLHDWEPDYDDTYE